MQELVEILREHFGNTDSTTEITGAAAWGGGIFPTARKNKLLQPMGPLRILPTSPIQQTVRGSILELQPMGLLMTTH